MRVAGGLGGIDEAPRGGPGFLTVTGDRECECEICPCECVRVATARELGAAPLDAPFRLADVHIGTAELALVGERNPTTSLVDHRLSGVAVARSILDPSHHVALRRHDV